ncbi:MAG TPA: hypothetical protein VF678_02180, partial [bacterium]
MPSLSTLLTWIAAALAVLVLTLWLTTRYLVFRAERQYPPLGQTVTVRGQTMHYVAEGPVAEPQGPPLLLIHGAFGGLQDF